MSDDTTLSTYLVIASYPIIMLLIPEPIWLGWWLRNGGGRAMPKETQRRSEKNEGFLLIAKFAILVASTIGLMRHTLVLPQLLGFRPINLRTAILVGLAGGLVFAFWTLGMLAAVSQLPGSEGHVPFLLREPAWRILFVIIVGAFAEEYWRALSLHLLRRQATSVGWSLLTTSLVFGLGHLLSPQTLPRALGRILQAAIGGLFLGGLYLEFHTLLIPFIAHCMVNSFGALMGRRKLQSARLPHL